MPIPNTPTLWNIPYQRNPFFTGREDVLSQLHRTLQTDATVALSHPQGISGLGGIGKTQTALEYAYRYGAEYDVVLWVRADSLASLTSGLIELAHVLQLPERNAQDQDIIIQAVLRWLRMKRDWLLVFDSMDEPSVVEPFLPKTGQGHILFTTRAHSLGGIAQRLEVRKMEPETGALLLLRRASLLPSQATLQRAESDDRGIASQISEALDGLPLALDQAGAYIKETPCALTDYLKLYQERRREVLETRGSFDRSYPASVATTWSLSFEKVNQANPAAVDLLDFCAFLAPDAIPEEMIATGAQYLTASLQKVLAHPLQFDQAIAALLAYSLVGRNADATLGIHRLVQAVLQDRLSEEERHIWRERAMLAVNAAFPHVEPETWSRCERMLLQALFVTQSIEQDQVRGEEAGRLLYETASYLRERARYAEAEPLFQRALHIREQQLGSEHPEVASSLNGLGSLYYWQGKFGKAEPLLQRALLIFEQQLGPEHVDTAYPLNGLANLYRMQGKYAQAEPLYQRALHIREQQLGPQHPQVAASLNGLANLYSEQGEYAQAEPLFQRALHIWEQQLGPQHTQVAYPLNGLAILYCEQGKYAEAEPLYQRALHIWEQQLGPEHPQVIYPLTNLAELYSQQGKYAEAEPLFQRALHVLEQQLGPQHTQVAYPLTNLAELYREQGKYGEAEPLYQRALHIWEQQLGPQHPNVAHPLHGLAELYREQGKYGKAEPLYQRALHIREQQLGEAHPDTAETIHDLARFWETQGNSEEARAWYARALAVREQAFGRHHPKTTETRTCFITLLHAMGLHEEAVQLEGVLFEQERSEEEQKGQEE
jgi:tetratricopeptide (TPR) repeat protein